MHTFRPQSGHLRGVVWSLILLAVFAGNRALVGLAESPFLGKLQWQEVSGKSIALLGGERIVWQFNYDPTLSKPHFHPVSTPRGDVLTWNQPPDHPWHHALWFCWKEINGVNYWEANVADGLTVGRTRWSDVGIETHDDGSAQIRMHLEYLPAGGEVVLTEERRMDIAAPSGEQQYSMDWTSTFTAREADVMLDRTPIPPDPNGKPWGGYAGLSIRFAKDFGDRQAISLAGLAGFGADGVHRSTSPAMDYSGMCDGRAAGIAILDHPDNPRHPTPWYVIRSDMTYLNAAILTYEPLRLPARDSLTLKYRLLVHADRWDVDTLRKVYTDYLDSITQATPTIRR